MRIRQLIVSRFRGIRQLAWDIAGTTVCLIGPGDSTKTTILDAIEYVLSPRWNVAVADADFYDSDTTEPIEIIATIGELPKALVMDEKFGLHLRGWNAVKGLRDEPDDDDEPVLSVRLRIDESLEPAWTVITNRSPDGIPISARDREKLGVARLAANPDRQLSWSRGSALSRFTGDIEDIGRILAEANRSARDVIQKADLPQLTDAASRAQKAAAHFGARPNSSYRPALDAATSSEGTGALSLHDGAVPARQAGLGTRRLVALALQRSAVREGAVLLVDEVEHGLEPYRLRHLVRMLRPGNKVDPDAAPSAVTPNGQVFMTTHSNIAVVELEAKELHVVRCQDGVTTVQRVPEALQATIRAMPEALLGKKVIVCEGKTEYGFCRALDQNWTEQSEGRSLAYLGVVPVVGESSGSNAPRVANDLAKLGYRVAFFCDSDVKISPDVSELEAAGIRVIQWAGECAIEQQLCLDLPWAGLQELVDLACELHEETSVLDAVAARLVPKGAHLNRNISHWLAASYSHEVIRNAIGATAKEKKEAAEGTAKSGKGWFKRIDFGEMLGELVIRQLSGMSGTDTAAKIEQLREWACGP